MDERDLLHHEAEVVRSRGIFQRAAKKLNEVLNLCAHSVVAAHDVDARHTDRQRDHHRGVWVKRLWLDNSSSARQISRRTNSDTVT